MRKKIIIIFQCILIISTSTFGVKIEPDKKIKLSKKVLLQFPLSFCVTEDDLILISDFKAGDVKIYNNRGQLVKVLGREGYGPNEFAKPFFCFYTQRKFIIADSGQRRIFFYDRKDKFDFVRTKEVLPPNIGFQFYVKNNKLFIAGTARDKDTKPYEFYMINLEKDHPYTYYLPGQMKYGLNSVEQYNTHLLRKPELSTIGTHAQFDIQGNFAYYSWEGDLKIFKINLETKEIKTFGKKSSYYIKPYASQKLINAFQTMQFPLISA